MVRIILVGCSGKMGRVIASVVNERKDCSVVAGVDPNTNLITSFPIFPDPFDYNGAAEVIIDFSHPSGVTRILEYALVKKLPIVMATTGLSSSQIEEVKAAANSIPVFLSANMSIGINLLVELAKRATSALSQDFDIEIVEKHHNQKIDAPSGTALMLSDAISQSLKESPRYVYDRHSVRKKRDKNEIGFHSIRGGTIVGEHDVIFAGHDEIITLSHTALSKEIFATGAINAALFLIGKEAGLYNMSDMLKDRLNN